MRLYTYWRSSAAYRLRIALNLKEIEHQLIPVDLVQGDHRKDEYLAINPQGLVPSLEYNGEHFAQSIAIMELLDELHPEKPLLPADIKTRARVRAMAQMVACDVHPLNNLRVLKYLSGPLDLSPDRRQAWYEHWIAAGFEAYEALVDSNDGIFSVGDSPTMADICLIPQIYNARRFKCDLTPYPKIKSIEAKCNKLSAFEDAVPENQAEAK